MRNIKLDKKDLRILDELDKNPNISIKHLSKNIHVNSQVCLYRLNKLLAQKTIYSFYTLIDCAKLGYTLFRAHIRLKNVTREEYEKFAHLLYTQTPSMWVAFVSGSFDIIYDVFAKSTNEFEHLFIEILKKNKDIIQGYDSFIVLNVCLYQNGYFVEKHTSRYKIIFNEKISNLRLDNLDKKIINLIKLNSRLPYEHIGNKIGLTRNAVKARIKRMENHGLISGYKIFINFSHLHLQSYKIFVKYDSQKKDKEQTLLDFIQQTPGIIATLRLFGKWDLDIEVHKEDNKSLQEFIMELRNKFDIIENYEIVSIIEEVGINWYPDRLQ
jgi:Lrp/AsnC family transcriptional regulator, leucine-responsive regulatory protein